MAFLEFLTDVRDIVVAGKKLLSAMFDNFVCALILAALVIGAAVFIELVATGKIQFRRGAK